MTRPNPNWTCPPAGLFPAAGQQRRQGRDRQRHQRDGDLRPQIHHLYQQHRHPGCNDEDRQQRPHQQCRALRQVAHVAELCGQSVTQDHDEQAYLEGELRRFCRCHDAQPAMAPGDAGAASRNRFPGAVSSRSVRYETSSAPVHSRAQRPPDPGLDSPGRTDRRPGPPGRYAATAWGESAVRTRWHPACQARPSTRIADSTSSAPSSLVQKNQSSHSTPAT